MSDNIIAMARAAGFARSSIGIGLDGMAKSYVVFDESKLEAFAQLVAAAEREACALVCEAGVQNASDWDSSAWDQACENRAAAIRALGERT